MAEGDIGARGISKLPRLEMHTAIAENEITPTGEKTVREMELSMQNYLRYVIY